MTDDEAKRRKTALVRLLVAYGEESRARAEMFYVETAEIPLYFLELAAGHLIRNHAWPRCPLIADIWNAARSIAKMGRAQYLPNTYAPARGWPPEGRCHGARPGEFETIKDDDLARLSPGASTHKLGSGE